MKKIISVFVAAVILISVLIQPSFAETSLEEDLRSKQILESELNSIKQSRDSISRSLAEARAKQADQQKIVSLIYAEIDNYQAELSTVTALISEYTALIREKEEQISELNVQLDKNYELFKERIAFAQDSGKMGYIDFILGSSDISDILSRSEVINDMLEYDRTIITSISEDKKSIELAKIEIENTLSLCNQKQSEYENIVVELDKKVSEANEYLNQLKDNVAAQQQMLNEQNKLKNQTEERLAQIVQQISIKENKDFDATFIWPLPITFPGYISQYFHSGHSGLDIAVGGWGNNGKIPALAVASGTVVDRNRYGDWGNLVIVKHNEQYSTYYAHLDSFSVSMGQKVSKGQQVGFIGSTGDSTGPHLHIVFLVDGIRQDPLKFIKKP